MKSRAGGEAGDLGSPGPCMQGGWDQAEAWDLEARIQEQRRVIAETEARWAQLCRDREELGAWGEVNRRAIEVTDARGPQPPSSRGGELGLGTTGREGGEGEEASAAKGQVGAGSPGGAHGHMGRSRTMPIAEVGRRKVMPTGRNTALARWSEALEGHAAAFSTPQDHGYHTDGSCHVGQETTAATTAKPQGYVASRSEWEGDEEVELDYEEEGDDWEDGEIQEAEVSGVTRGGRGRKCGATSSSAFALQDTGLAEGPSGVRLMTSRGRLLRKTPQNLRAMDRGQEGGANKKKESLSASVAEPGIQKTGDDTGTEDKEWGSHRKRLPYMGLAKPLGSHVADKMKARIWRHEYVDVFKLLHRDIQAKEEEWKLARRPRVPITMDNWTSAVLIFASIYCEKYPDRAIALFKYMDIIRKSQLHFGGFAWLSYDEEFRARVSVNPEKPWGDVDPELWMQWMASAQSSASTHTASGLPVVYKPFQSCPTQGGAGAVNKTPVPTTGACWNFNKGFCSRPKCRFKHDCSKCGGCHPVTQCFSLSSPAEQCRASRGWGMQGATASKGSYAS
ncbi:hypothetical protein NDU88_005620 [Pleurodeles waltl]|uniref:C3H1-type domain-containing protein n=1 Tax=Pleurodeles waltl TaxID=8319 RepID=A0AAV7MYL7_PLEWA|nr:hypothetical protein NDU88_005620 [Pleurodeles waltl]